jgi:hypothetical protein
MERQRPRRGRQDVDHRTRGAKQSSVQVDWIKPFRAHNLNEFTIHAQGHDTQVTWSIQASNLYAVKLIGIFVNIESQFGQHMESGLSNLKRTTEKKESDRSVDKMPGSSPVP